jgi:hypothetical protein
MDVRKDIGEYVQLLQQHKRVLQDAKRKQGERPRDRLHRDAMVLKFMMGSMSIAAKSGGKDAHLAHSSFVPPAYTPCTTSLDDMKPITIKDLRLETHHRGRYIVLRAITSPYRMTGILVLAEDERGDATLLQIYQQEPEAIRPITDVVDKGSIILLKEPFFKVTASGDYSLRVDHLSDIVRLGNDNTRIPSIWRPRLLEIEQSADSLKLEGNTHMGEGRYWRAIDE